VTDEQARIGLELVRAVVACHFMHATRAIPFQDLVGYGLLGYVEAHDRYDAAHHDGARFETFAWQRVRGAIIDGIRAEAWAPRSLLRLYSAALRVREELRVETGRDPSIEAIADRLDVTLDQLRRAFHAFRPHLSLDAPVSHTGQDREAIVLYDTVADDSVPDPLAVPLLEELGEELHDCLAELPDRDRYALALVAEGVTLRQIGATLGVSESRVSQIVSRARGRLRRDPRVQALVA
jgi:RNA polymerase sigma factor FliA